MAEFPLELIWYSWTRKVWMKSRMVRGQNNCKDFSNIVCFNEIDSFMCWKLSYMHGLTNIIDVMKGHNKFKTHKVQIYDLMQAWSLHNETRAYLSTLTHRSMNEVLLLTRYRSRTCSSKMTPQTCLSIKWNYSVKPDAHWILDYCPTQNISWLVRLEG